MALKHKDRTVLGQDAEAVAVDILTWLAGEPDMMARYMALTGLTADGLRRAAGEPGFYGGLTDFLMNHEPTLLAFCAATGTAPEKVVRAHHELVGPDGSGAF